MEILRNRFANLSKVVETTDVVVDALYAKQINLIVELFQFYRTYHAHHLTPSSHADFFIQDIEARDSLLMYIVDLTVKAWITKKELHGAANKAEYVRRHAEEFLNALATVLHASNSRHVLNMIFQMIYRLPKHKKMALEQFLPWGKRSWYYLDFCASIFKDDNETIKQNLVPIVIYRDLLSAQDQEYLLQFLFFSKAPTNFVDAAMRGGLAAELICLCDFFTQVKLQQDVTAINSEDMINPFTAIMHLKHTSFYIKLQALSPRLDSRTAVPLFEKGATAIAATPLAQLHVSNIDQTNRVGRELKFTLGFLQRMIMIGEIFVESNWGEKVNEFESLNPAVFVAIRDGLVHIEDLLSADLIYHLETNHDLIAKIHHEWKQLSIMVMQMIKDKQAQLQENAGDNLMNDEWFDQIWRALRGYYRKQKSFNPEEFLTNANLVDQAKIDSTLLHIKPNARAYYSAMLSGKCKFVEPEKCEYIVADGTTNSDLKKVKKVFERARKNHNLLKMNHVRQHGAGKKDRQQKLDRFMKKSFHETDCLAHGLIKENQAKHMTPPEAIHIACNRLKDRLILLKRLVAETLPNVAANEPLDIDELHELMVSDVEFLFSCHYLICQIISMMNKLSSYGILHEIHRPLLENLEAYVRLRNAIIHTDAVIDSQLDAHFQMQNRISRLVAEFVTSILNVHHDAILKADATLLVASFEQQGNMPGERQHEKGFLRLEAVETIEPELLSIDSLLGHSVFTQGQNRPSLQDVFQDRNSNNDDATSKSKKSSK